MRLCVVCFVQALDAERQELRAAATEVAELRAWQQAAAEEQHQQRQALQHTVQDLQQRVQQQEQELAQQEQQRAELQAELQRWQQQYAELQEQSRQQQDQGLQQLSERLREAVDQKQELQVRLKAQLAELQQQLQDTNASALQAAAEKAALTAQLASAEQAKGVCLLAVCSSYERHVRISCLQSTHPYQAKSCMKCPHLADEPHLLLCCTVCMSAAELTGRLDQASIEVAQMRDTVQDMAQRMAERDQAVAAELHTFQHEQLAKQQRQLSEAHAAADAATAAADTLRDALLAVHTALSPHSLAYVLGLDDRAQQQPGFSLGPEGYEELTSRLLGAASAVSAADGEAVAARVRELLAQVSAGCGPRTKPVHVSCQCATLWWPSLCMQPGAVHCRQVQLVKQMAVLMML
jgi:hypothetical protein